MNGINGFIPICYTKTLTLMKPVIRTLTLFFCLGSSFTLRAANRFWIASATANWNVAANWSATSGGAGGAGVPAVGDIANFDNLGLGNCNIPAAVTITGLIINGGYTGIITQGANPITLSGAATFSGGSFIGSSATITINGTVTLSGTSFTLPALLNMGGGSWIYTSGVLDPVTNNSTVVFSSGMTITGSHTLNNVNFNNTTPWPATYTLAGGTNLTINGNMTMSGTAALNFSGGTINLLGNLSLTNTGTGAGGSTVLTFAGTVNQAITSALSINQSALPSVNINKTSGTLTLPAMISMGGNSWTYTAGTLDALTNNSTVAFDANTTITGSHTLNNITFTNITPWPMTFTVAAGTTLTASGNMTMSGTAALNFSGGTIALQGNLSLTNTATGGGGSTVLAFTGAAGQTITSALPINQCALPSVNINKPSGTLTFPSLISMGGNNWTYTAGTLDPTSNNSTVAFVTNTTITGSHSLNNITFSNTTPWGMVYTLGAGTVLTATGNMNMTGSANFTFTGGTIALQGNLNLSNTSTGDGGTTVIAFTGAGNQAITSALAINQNSLPSVNINKPSGTLTFPALISMAGSTWTYTTGTLDPTTNNSTVVFDGNTTIAGSHSLNNIDFDNSTPWGITYTLGAGTTLTANGNMTMSGTANTTFTNGTINLLGNLILTNTANGDGGSTVIAFAGTTNQAIISSLPINESSLPSVNINKASGTLTFPALITMVGSAWTYTTGTLDVLTNNSTVVFGGNTLFTGSHTLNNINFNNSTPWGITYTVAAATVLTAGGDMTMSGGSGFTFSGGTINLLGNLNLTNTSVNDGGSTVVTFISSTAQAINSSLPVNESGLPSININKTGGTLTFPSLLTMAGNTWTWTAGTVDAASAASTVYFTSNTTVKSAGMNFYNVNVASGTTTLSNNLSANSNMTISGTGVLAPGANTINLLGNWNDRSTAGFTEATSTVSFSGSTVQTITTPGGENFAGLTVNNSGGGIQLINNVTTSKTLTMTQGNIDLNGNNFTLGLSAANNGTLAYTSGTVINAGSLTRWFKTGVIATGSAAGLFPVGTLTDYRPFSVSAPAAGPTTGGSMTLVYTDAVTNTNVSFPDGVFTVQKRKDLNWALSTTGMVGGTYNLGISGTGYQTIANVNDLRLTLAGSVVGTAGVNAGTTTNPQVNRTGLTLANLSNTFYLATVNPTMTTLPVSLISFTAAASNDEVVLNWSTAEETNSDHYTIERSKDGNSWEELQQVAAAGTSSSLLTYTAYDPSPLTGSSLYRLMMTDRDGGITYSGIRSVNFSDESSAISVYPNPAASYLNIRFSHAGTCAVTLLNEIGQVMTGSVSPNGDNLVLNVSAMQAGIYFVRISGAGVSETRKIMIRR